MCEYAVSACVTVEFRGMSVRCYVCVTVVLRGYMLSVRCYVCMCMCVHMYLCVQVYPCCSILCFSGAVGRAKVD